MLTIALALNIFQPYILGILGQWKLSCSINPFEFGQCTFIFYNKRQERQRFIAENPD